MSGSFDQHYKDLKHQVEASEGHRIYQRSMILDISHYIFVKNHEELASRLDQFSRPDVAIQFVDLKDRSKMDHFLKEVTRLLHNYLAAVTTLVEHTRKFAKQLYIGTDFWTEYSTKVAQTFTDSPLWRFVQDLRNYSLHNEIPLVTFSINFARDHSSENAWTGSSFVALDVATLRTWKEWKSESKRYLAILGDEVNLGNVIQDHWSAVVDFYVWFGQRRGELHREAFEELEDLKRRLRELQSLARLCKEWSQGLARETSKVEASALGKAALGILPRLTSARNGSRYWR